MQERPQNGSIFSFVSAHGGSRAGAVAEQLSRTSAEGPGSAVLFANFRTRDSLWQDDPPRSLGAIVIERDGLDVLDAPDVNPRELVSLLDHARDNYDVIFVDASDATPAQRAQVLRASEAIFVVSGSARKSLEGVLKELDWLQSLQVDDRCALLLHHDPNGLNAADAEEITGFPVCAYVDSERQIAQLARWLVANAEPETLIAAVA